MSSALGSSSADNVTPNLFTLVPVDLFRTGNGGSPKLDHVRLDKDIETAKVTIAGETIVVVKPQTGGISTFESSTYMVGKVWKIPAGTKLPPTIIVVKDHYNKQMKATHYSISPAYEMPLATYVLGLRELATSAVPMFMTAIKTGKDELKDEPKPVRK